MAQTSKHKHSYAAINQPGSLLTRALTRLLCFQLAFQPLLAQAVANGKPALNKPEHPASLHNMQLIARSAVGCSWA